MGSLSLTLPLQGQRKPEMAAYVVILSLLTLGSTNGDRSPLSNLRESIFHEYDKNVIPQDGPEAPPLTVQLGLAPKWMELDSNGLLTVSIWLRLVWTDYGLSWDPRSHNSIEMLRVPSSEVWRPDIALYNKQDLDNGILAADPDSSNTNVYIHSDGNILWVTPVSHKVLCEGVTYANWPWGRQTCNLSFGSWSYDTHSYDLVFHGGQEEMDLRQFGEYNQFKILKQTALREVKKFDCCPYPYVNLNFIFSVQRKYIVDPDLGRIDNPEPEAIDLV